MYSVLIADDEAKFREYVRNCIASEPDVFQIVGEAKNGLEVLEIVDNQKVDLILLDINMPLMDGLEVAEQLQKINSDIFVILVTGYNEFEYARRAIKLGVENYILKPFTKVQLMEQLAQTITKLKAHKENAKETNNFTNLARDSFVMKLLLGKLGNNEEILEAQFGKFKLPMNSHRFSVAVIDILNRYQSEEEEKLWFFSVENILTEMRDANGERYIMQGISSNRLICIFNHAKGKEEEIPVSYIRLYQYCKKYLGIELIIGVGAAVDKVSDLYKSYDSSLEVVSNGITYGRKGIVTDFWGEKSEEIGFNSLSSGKIILSSLRARDIEGIEEELISIKADIIEKHLSTAAIHAMVLGMISSCLSYINEMGTDVKKVFGRDFQPITEIRNLNSVDNIFDWELGVFEKTIQYYDGEKTSRSRIIAGRVKKYIEQNYADPLLRAEDIANSLFIDPSYVRKVLVKEMDTTAVELITAKRMEKAREILLNEKVKLSALAERVGYNDPKYFSKCFKKHYGISPREFSNLIVNE